MDRKEQRMVIFMTQIHPASELSLDPQVDVLALQAIVH
jgi:hypothetical protein